MAGPPAEKNLRHPPASQRKSKHLELLILRDEIPSDKGKPSNFSTLGSFLREFFLHKTGVRSLSLSLSARGRSRLPRREASSDLRPLLRCACPGGQRKPDRDPGPVESGNPGQKPLGPPRLPPAAVGIGSPRRLPLSASPVRIYYCCYY